MYHHIVSKKNKNISKINGYISFKLKITLKNINHQSETLAITRKITVPRIPKIFRRNLPSVYEEKEMILI
jgi:hypothetical protein